MQRLHPVVALAVGLVMVAAGTARAFDGKRSGFILGFGLGGGYSHVTQTLSSTGTGEKLSTTADKYGVASEFKIGAGIGERFQLYYANRMNWFSAENALKETVTFTSGVGLVGVSYYLEDETPSFYVLGLVGISTWDTPLEEYSDPSYGFGIGAGAGWEFTRHFSLEATVNWGNPQDDSPTDDWTHDLQLDTDFVSVLLTINAIAY